MADQRRRKKKSKPWDYKRDKSTVRYKRDAPRSTPHRDQYAEVRGLSRSHYRSDGTPKRAYARPELAEAVVLTANGKVRSYQCPECDNWHLATVRSDRLDPAVLDDGSDPGAAHPDLLAGLEAHDVEGGGDVDGLTLIDPDDVGIGLGPDPLLPAAASRHQDSGSAEPSTST